MKISRRQALAAVGTSLAVLHGKQVVGQSRGLVFALDAYEAVVIQYRGHRVIVTPSDIMEALGGVELHAPMPQLPNPSQFPRR